MLSRLYVIELAVPVSSGLGSVQNPRHGKIPRHLVGTDGCDKALAIADRQVCIQGGDDCRARNAPCSCLRFLHESNPCTFIYRPIPSPPPELISYEKRAITGILKIPFTAIPKDILLQLPLLGGPKIRDITSSSHAAMI